LRKRFDAAYAAIYGHQGAPDEEIQLVRLRLSAFGVIDKPKLATVPDDMGAQPLTVRSVYFEGAFHASPVWERGNLGRSARIAGPAIVEEFGSTTVVPPGWDGVVENGSRSHHPRIGAGGDDRHGQRDAGLSLADRVLGEYS
jgi:N-methylhydantoinase A